MPDYSTDGIDVLAVIHVKVGSEGKEFGPGDAAAVKAEAAAWLRALDDDKPSVTVSVKIEQHSADVPWKDGDGYKWHGPAPLGREYAAQVCERFPTWGGSR